VPTLEHEPIAFPSDAPANPPLVAAIFNDFEIVPLVQSATTGINPFVSPTVEALVTPATIVDPLIKAFSRLNADCRSLETQAGFPP